MHQFATHLRPPARAQRPPDRDAFAYRQVGRATRNRDAAADQVLVPNCERRRDVLPSASLVTSDTGAWRTGCAGAEVDLIDVLLRTDCAATASLDARVAGMVAGRSSDQMDATQHALRCEKRRLEQTEPGLAKQSVPT